MDARLAADVMEVLAVFLVVAWLVRRVWMDDRLREATADDDVWHAGAEMLRRARERLQQRRT